MSRKPDPVRDPFEAWMREHYPDVELMRYQGRYAHFDTNMALGAWMAGRKYERETGARY